METSVIPESNLEFAKLLRKQAACVYLACEASVADDLSASLREAAKRLEVTSEGRES